MLNIEVSVNATHNVIMSSDSELEEFFDAEDHTPDQNNVLFNTAESEKKFTTIEDEEILLQFKKTSEERRKQDDVELEKLLGDLHRKKQIEEEKRLEAEKKAQENEKRRRKLEMMRQALSDDKSPVKSDGELFFVDLANPDSNSSFDSQSTVPNSEKSDKVNSSLSTSSNPSNSLLSSPLAPSQASAPMTDLTMIVTTPVNPQEQSCDKPTENLEGCLLQEQNEPDIVKSAKPRNLTPPSTLDTKHQQLELPTVLDPPVAPPRRKKKPKEIVVSNEDLSIYYPATASPGLPAELLTPVSTVESLTKELEHSLDLQSALEGSRIINAEEAEAGAVNSDQDSVSPILEQDVMTLTESSNTLGKDKCSVSSLQAEDPIKDSSNPSGDDSPMVRPRSNSGRSLTDQEILESVFITNLDTGQKVPLSVAEDELPRCMNPLDLHIIRRTHEYLGEGDLHKAGQSDEDESKSETVRHSSDQQGTRSKATKIKKFLGKTVGKTMSRVKSVADQGKKALQGDETGMEEEYFIDGKIFKIKVSSSNKGPWDFSQPRLLQDLSGEHSNAIWTMKFSPCGRLLATGGQDSVLRIWVLKSAYSYFEDLRQKYVEAKLSPSASRESLDSLASSEASSLDQRGPCQSDDDYKHAPFIKKPFCVYRGHTADLLDISWSKNYFILSSSMDKTVRLWHISRRECLCTFQHIDFVTAIVFHPKDDRYFLSGSLDGKLRLWNIPEKKVTMWNEVSGPSNLITTANFCNNGKYAVVGTYDGKCIFFTTEQLKYSTQIHVRSTRGKNAKGRKVTGIEPLPGEDKILVTTNDSRIRLYDLRDLTLTCKYKGGTNNSSQIKASFSAKGKYIICGSEDHFVYLWKTHHDYYKFSSARRDRNDYWEAIKVHNAVVTVAILAPNPLLLLKPNMAFSNSGVSDQESSQQDDREIIVSADFTGAVKVIQCKIKNPG